MDTVYKVKVIGKGVIFQTLNEERAIQRAQECCPEARARIIRIPPSR